ncbi:DUF3883 domain-containing protein [Azospirillum sp. HJ39]|uniref:DUF3883 domain-containing protein n=1 Tax=Azospirillum sp. HJ39 TaxID=3159496 RepID=UPI0035576427
MPGIDRKGPMIFFNIGWMKRYGGPASNDPTLGTHGYLQGKFDKKRRRPQHGHEAANFLPLDGRLRGYAPLSASRGIRLTRLGAEKDVEWMEGVLVVWFARNPNDQRSYVVGWYRDALLHRYEQNTDGETAWIVNGDPIRHIVETLTENGVCLPVEDRTLPVPSAQTEEGGFGQNCIWYCDNHPSFRKRVLDFIDRYEGGGPTPSSRRPPRNYDPAKRIAVENEAMERARAHFESAAGGRLRIDDVSLKARGWDLEGFPERGNPLLIEVKGVSGADVVVELTPNEFEKMRTPGLRDRYVIFVSTGCLSNGVADHIFRYDIGSDSWKDDRGRRLKEEQRIGVILRHG